MPKRASRNQKLIPAPVLVSAAYESLDDPSGLTSPWEARTITEHFRVWSRELCDVQTYGERLPPKIRKLISELQKAGFIDRGGKGSHRNFVHPKVTKPITISGASGDAAKQYQVRAVRRAIEETKS